MFKGDNIRGTLIDTALSGILFVLVCDMIGRLVIFPYEIPINLIIGIVGSAVFIVILFRRLNPGKKYFWKKSAQTLPAGGTEK
jgi:iron complex transport system permease protein